MSIPDKSIVYAAILVALKERLAALQASLRHTHASATDDEARADNKYDTRSLEMSYLASGMTDRIGELRRVLSSYHFWTLPPRADVVRPGALVILLDDDDHALFCFVAPYGTADSIVVAGQQVRVITLKAPLGRALVGKSEGDEVSVIVDGVARSWELDSIA